MKEVDDHDDDPFHFEWKYIDVYFDDNVCLKNQKTSCFNTKCSAL